jgi:hypothetical protein
MGFSSAGVPDKKAGELFRENRGKLIKRVDLKLKPADVLFGWDTVILFDTIGPAEKYTRVLDNRGRELSALNYVMDSGNWAVFSRGRFIYDNLGNQIVKYNDHLANGEWDFFTRDTMKYDSVGNLIEGVIQWWLSGAWENVYRYYTNYDDAGNILSEGNADWLNGVWVNAFRDTFTRDAGGKALTILWEDWIDGSWSNSGFETNTFDESGRLLLTLSQIMQGGAWVNSDRSTNSYNANSQVLVQLLETWDTVNQLWLNNRSISSSYDASGNLLGVLTESRDKAGSAWFNVRRKRYTCDADGNSTGGINEQWKSGSWSPGLSSIDIYSKKEIVYTFYYPPRYQYHATFISLASGVDEVSNSMVLSVYPNPASEKLTIDCNNLKPGQLITIYDMGGRPVLQTCLTGLSEIDISRLASGTYLLRLGSGKEAVSKVFVKQ